MQRLGILLAVIGLLLGCGRPVVISVPATGTIEDAEPQGEAPVLDQRYERLFEPRWL